MRKIKEVLSPRVRRQSSHCLNSFATDAKLLPHLNVTNMRNRLWVEESVVRVKKLLRLLRERYKGSSKSDKTKILDEFVAVSGCHRKHAIRLLARHGRSSTGVRHGVRMGK